MRKWKLGVSPLCHTHDWCKPTLFVIVAAAVVSSYFLWAQGCFKRQAYHVPSIYWYKGQNPFKLFSRLYGGKQKTKFFPSVLVLLIRIRISFTFSQIIAICFRFLLWGGKNSPWWLLRHGVFLWNNKLILDKATLRPGRDQTKTIAVHNHVSAKTETRTLSSNKKDPNSPSPT